MNYSPHIPHILAPNMLNGNCIYKAPGSSLEERSVLAQGQEPLKYALVLKTMGRRKGTNITELKRSRRAAGGGAAVGGNMASRRQHAAHRLYPLLFPHADHPQSVNQGGRGLSTEAICSTPSVQPMDGWR